VTGRGRDGEMEGRGMVREEKWREGRESEGMDEGRER